MDQEWDLNKFIVFLRSKKIEWQDIYWKLVSCLIEMDCEDCGDHFSGNKINHCNFHSSSGYNAMESTDIYYPCCNNTTLKFGQGKVPGCKAKMHTPSIETSKQDKLYRGLTRNFAEVGEPIETKGQIINAELNEQINLSKCLSLLVPEFIKSLHNEVE
jgi:hypothetical protein